MIRVALFGYGTVGSGVQEIADLNKEKVSLVKIFDREEKREEIGPRFEGSKEKIFEDPSISTVVEAMGGDTLAHEVIVSALKSHKHVITSNKETVAKHFGEYLSLAKENGVTFQCEAAVGGGIPLLAPIASISSFDEITSIEGILNGTTNFILTRMEEGMEYEEALTLAQEKGFAERDPSADIDGIDMVRKISILASLVTKRKVDIAKIPHYGLRNLNKEILEEIHKENRVLKYIAEFSLQKGFLEIEVTPKALRKDHPLAALKEELNGVRVLSKHNGPLCFFGKGAGKEDTASAIFQDLMRVEENRGFPPFSLGEEEKIANKEEAKYLVFRKGEKEIVKNPYPSMLEEADFVAKL